MGSVRYLIFDNNLYNVQKLFMTIAALHLFKCSVFVRILYICNSDADILQESLNPWDLPDISKSLDYLIKLVNLSLFFLAYFHMLE